MTNTLPFNYVKQRTLCPRESLLHFGWDALNIKTSNLRRAIEGWPEGSRRKKSAKKAVVPTAEPELEAQATKKRRRQPQQRRSTEANLLLDLAGNAQAIPDIALMLYTAELAIDTDMWTNGPLSPAHVAELLGPLGAADCVLDPEESPDNIQGRFAGSDGESEEVDPLDGDDEEMD